MTETTETRTKLQRPPAKKRQQIRRELWVLQGGRCYYCREPVALDKATLDHIIPLSRGGSNLRTNLAVACFPCNHRKGSAVWRNEPITLALTGTIDTDWTPAQWEAAFRLWLRSRGETFSGAIEAQVVAVEEMKQG